MKTLRNENGGEKGTCGGAVDTATAWAFHKLSFSAYFVPTEVSNGLKSCMCICCLVWTEVINI
jgi:hypothetical protein